MIIIPGNPVEIRPEEGMKLMKDEVIADNQVYLGVGANPNEWYEITEEEALRIKEEQGLLDEDSFDSTNELSDDEIPAWELKQMIEEVL